jgi:hypothetical protein
MTGAGMQRWISVGIGVLIALALLIAMPLVFGTTQPDRAIHQSVTN